MSLNGIGGKECDVYNLNLLPSVCSVLLAVVTKMVKIRTCALCLMLFLLEISTCFAIDRIRSATVSGSFKINWRRDLYDDLTHLHLSGKLNWKDCVGSGITIQNCLPSAITHDGMEVKQVANFVFPAFYTSTTVSCKRGSIENNELEYVRYLSKTASMNVDFILKGNDNTCRLICPTKLNDDFVVVDPWCMHMTRTADFELNFDEPTTKVESFMLKSRFDFNAKKSNKVHSPLYFDCETGEISEHPPLNPSDDCDWLKLPMIT